MIPVNYILPSTSAATTCGLELALSAVVALWCALACALWWHCAVLTARKRRSTRGLHDEAHDSRLDAGAGSVDGGELLFEEKAINEEKNCFTNPITDATGSFALDVRRLLDPSSLIRILVHTLEIVAN